MYRLILLPLLFPFSLFAQIVMTPPVIHPSSVTTYQGQPNFHVGEYTDGFVTCLAVKQVRNPITFFVRTNRMDRFFEDKTWNAGKCLSFAESDLQKKLKASKAPEFFEPPQVINALAYMTASGSVGNMTCTIWSNQTAGLMAEFIFPHMKGKEREISHEVFGACLESVKRFETPRPFCPAGGVAKDV